MNSSNGRPDRAVDDLSADWVDVPLGLLGGADSPRSGGVDAEHVQALIDVADSLPPIVVHRSTMRIVDGVHRVAAARRRGASSIRVRYYDGSEEGAFRLAVEVNVRHGLPLPSADRRAAAARLVASHPEWSNRAIAHVTGLAVKSIATIRRATEDVPQLPTRIGLDGRVRPLDATPGRLRAGEVLAERPEASLREVARESGVSVGTVRDVKSRLARGEDLVPGRGRSAPVPPGPGEDVDAGGEGAPVTVLVPATDGLAADPDQVLSRLTHDPTLRFSDSGRQLLRRLSAQAATSKDLATLTARVPPHCKGLVAEVVRAYSLRWLGFADELERWEERPAQ